MSEIALTGQYEEEEIDLLELLRVVIKHRWSILGLAFSFGLIATLVAFNMTPIYRSTATIMVRTERPKILSIDDVVNAQQGSLADYYQTQAEILKSREIAEKVVKKLDLVDNPVMDPRRKKPAFWKKWLAFAKGEEMTQQKAAKIVVDELRSGLNVNLVRNSQIVNISFDSPDKQLAAEIPNALAEAYIDNDMEARVEMTQKANAWLTQRMGGLRRKLESSEQALQAYREQANIVDTKGIALNGAGKQLDQISVDLIAARQRLAEAETAYDQVNALQGQPISAFESIPAVLKNALFQQAKENESKAEQTVAELSQRYGRLHPKMIAAQSSLKSAKENLVTQVNAVVGAIHKEYEMAKANEIAAEQAQGRMRSDIQNMSKKEFQLNVLQRDVDSNRQLYDLFMNRAKETNIGADLQSTVARIIDSAIPADFPVKPKKKLIVALAVLSGIFLGTLLAFLLEYLDNTVKRGEDVEKKLGSNLLGMVGIIDKGEPARNFIEDPNSEFSEEMRSIRTGVLLSSLDAPHKVLMVTSSIPQEGKSTLSMNLAFALGQMKKVLLIDSDLRRPSLGKTLSDDPNAPGLLEYLAGSAQISACIHRTSDPNVFLMPSGKLMTNPLELLSSRRFGELVGRLKEIYDMIVIDSPPVAAVSDALVLSKHADAVIYVVKADDTSSKLALSGIKRLREINAPVLGVVLNRVDLKEVREYGYGYRYAPA
jgi:capsular exopolysaccharide synthesis family protein